MASTFAPTRNKILWVMICIGLFMSFSTIVIAPEGTSTTKTFNGKTVTLKEGLTELGKVELVYNTDTCLSECYTIWNVTIGDNTKTFLNDLEFKTSLGAGKSISYKTEYASKFDKVPYDIKEQVCSIKSIDVNGTMKDKEICEWKVTGVGYEYIPKWEAMSLNVMPKGSYYIKVTGYKNRLENIDWQPTFYGAKVTEWAWWYGVQPVGYWKFNQSTGDATDYGWGGHNGVLTNTDGKQSYSWGKLGNASTYISDTVSVTDGRQTIGNFDDLGKNSFTLALWVNGSTFYNGNNKPIIGKGDNTGGANGWLLIWRESGADVGKIRMDSTFTLGGNIFLTARHDDGQWHRLVIIRDNSTGINSLNTYVDNVLESTFSVAQAVDFSNANNFRIGWHNVDGYSAYAEGIDDVQLYWNVWTPADVTFDWNGGIGREGDAEVFAPAVNVSANFPLNNSIITNPIVNFNCSGQTNGDTFTNFSLWTSNTGTSARTVSNLSLGNMNETIFPYTISRSITWKCEGCVSGGTCYFSPTYPLYLFENSINYNETTYEYADELIQLNATYDPLIYPFVIATLSYAGLNHTSSSENVGGNYIFSSAIPMTAGAQNNNFYWILSMLNATGGQSQFITTNRTQTVLPVGSINVTSTNCASGMQQAYYFTFADEQGLGTLMSNVSYNFQYGLGGNISGKLISGNLTNTYNLTICINSSLPFYSVGYGEVQYQTTGYTPRRYYFFQGTRLTNTTTNITLYSLLTTSSTPFSFTIQNNQYKPEVDAYASLLRWYPATNSYTLVDMGKTDNKGQTIMDVEVQNVDYRIGVYNLNGTLVRLYDPIRFICSVNPCEYSLFLPASISSYLNVDSLQQSLTFNATSKIFTYIYNDPTQGTQAMNLTVYRDTSASSDIICSSYGIGFTGLLACDVSAFSGTLRAVVYRSASPSVPIISLIVNTAQKLTDLAGGKTIGLFMSVILFTFAFLIGIYSPIVAIILGIASLVPALYFGAISYTVFIGIIILGFVVIHFLRRS